MDAKLYKETDLNNIGEEELSDLLNRWRDNDPDAINQLTELSYFLLKGYAAKERERHIDASDTDFLGESVTSFANSALLKLLYSPTIKENINSRLEMLEALRVSARNAIMNKVDYTNAHMRKLEGKCSLDSQTAQNQPSEEDKELQRAFDINNAIEELSKRNPIRATLIYGRFYANYSNLELAQMIDKSLSYVEKEIKSAKTWIEFHLDKDLPNRDE